MFGLLLLILRVGAGFTLFCAVIFGLITAATQSPDAAVTMSYKVADTGGTGAGIGWGAVPVAANGFRTGSQAMHKEMCQESPKSQSCLEKK